MELTPEMVEQLKADLKTAKTYQDLMGENGAISVGVLRTRKSSKHL